MAGRKFLDPNQDGVGRRNVLEVEVAREAREIELSRHSWMQQQGPQLGPEHEGLMACVVVERLLAHAVTGEQERALPRVPHREGEHPVEVGDAILPVRLVRVDDDLGIRSSTEDVTQATEPLAERLEIVDLTVLDHPNSPIFVRYGLVSCLQVDHAQPPDAKRRAAIQVCAFVVGTAVHEGRRHPLDGGPRAGQARVADEARDAAHVRCPTQTAGRRAPLLACYIPPDRAP